MKKTELQERVRESHAKLTGALEGLTEEQATRVGVTAKWSSKDALSHIAAWEIEGARIIEEIQAGTWKSRRLGRSEIDEFNARAVAERQARSMREVRDEFDAAHGRMEKLIHALPDEVDESSPIYKYIEGVTIRHHAHHAGQIEAYRHSAEAEA